MSGTKKEECKFENFPVGNTTACIDSTTKDCVYVENNIKKARGKYDCLCPNSYKLNSETKSSSRGGSEPLINGPMGKGKNQFELSCK